MTGLIILNGLFGWMDFLIIYKWAGYPMNAYATNSIDVLKLRNCPAIITVMINNFLKFGKQPGPTGSGLEDIYFFPSQQPINVVLLLMVVISVPSMLCVKPCALAYCCKPKHDHAEDFDRIEG